MANTNLTNQRQVFTDISGAGGETRTPNIQIRSLTLYPVELRPRAENLGRNF